MGLNSLSPSLPNTLPKMSHPEYSSAVSGNTEILLVSEVGLCRAPGVGTE